MRMPLSMSPTNFWNKYMENESPYWIGKFYHEQGEKNVDNGAWKVPDTEKDKKYDYIPGLNLPGEVKRKRLLYFEKAGKAMGISYVARTTLRWHLMEKTENIIKVRVNTSCEGPPYSDTMCVDQEMLVHMPEGCQNSCAMRFTLYPHMLKSSWTTPARIIQSSARAEGTQILGAYKKWIEEIEEREEHEMIAPAQSMKRRRSSV